MSAEPTPTLSRRHAAGSASARGLLFTVLGELVLPAGAAAWTSAVIDVLGRLGVEEKAARQALMRTASDGWLAPERIGRRTRWELSPAAEQLLRDGSRRIYGFTASAAEWDGQWLVVLARTAEHDRSARHLLRTRLSWLGLGSPAPGVWISTHASRAAEVEQVLTDTGVGHDAHAFIATHLSGGDVDTLVRQAWDLDAIEERYEQFLTRFRLRSVPDALATNISLVHAWRRFPWIDPVLPSELLPARWSGAAAATLFARLHGRLAEDARSEWADLNC